LVMRLAYQRHRRRYRPQASLPCSAQLQTLQSRYSQHQGRIHRTLEWHLLMLHAWAAAEVLGGWLQRLMRRQAAAVAGG
jgi:hypothetical protein